MIRRWLAALISHLSVLASGNVRISVLLLLVLEASALGVAYTTHRSRALFAELAGLRDDSEVLRSTWTQLLLEESTLGSFQRVMEVARTRLDMRPPTPHDMVILPRQ